jgi:CDP-glucose 4,6-dehydratase
MKELFANVYDGLTVLVTGHTGFKGSWLASWLIELGANVIGYSLPLLPTKPSNYRASKLNERITDIRGDITDLDLLIETIASHRPQLIFHLAAQPIVLRAVQEPLETFAANVNGTLNVLEAVRRIGGVRGLLCVTTDKVYKNQEWLWGYRENDRLGGHDPYSTSKAMAELAIDSYRQTYFPADRYEEHGLAIASARAGNVIGGGDFADYRLVPDCMRSLMAGKPIDIRNPASIRPWQHVLESASGYLWLAVKLLQDGPAYTEAWNFGPLEHRGITARALAEKLIDLWGSGSWIHSRPNFAPIETGQLRLSWEKSAARLNWRPIYSWQDALAELVDWFKSYEQSADMYAVGRNHIAKYVAEARRLDLEWARTASG